MTERKNRDEMVIATKYTTMYDYGAQDKSNKWGNSYKSMVVSVEASLKKLQTHYIDILYLHWYGILYPVCTISCSDATFHVISGGTILPLSRKLCKVSTTWSNRARSCTSVSPVSHLTGLLDEALLESLTSLHRIRHTRMDRLLRKSVRQGEWPGSIRRIPGSMECHTKRFRARYTRHGSSRGNGSCTLERVGRRKIPD